MRATEGGGMVSGIWSGSGLGWSIDVRVGTGQTNDSGAYRDKDTHSITRRKPARWDVRYCHFDASDWRVQESA